MLDDATKERIDADIASEDVVLYMKGTPVFPQCGFSAAVVGVLTHLGVPFRGINVLEDDSIREGIKAYSDWPTIPQLYVKREFVGGCDIIREMYETGELTEMFQTQGIDAKPS
ncbi:MAG: Grx4 family monothiol glutaredoxin [SAR116 cluster bacterium]|jgi:monothiol glutaredoxin|nr:MAG: Grx4 family monothiol glutaredoxin [SAR116 cluster bacterium]|tara:strand:- start:435 stop:773 length:339 start_codon:yes stop_codon:yes gene_type:complete